MRTIAEQVLATRLSQMWRYLPGSLVVLDGSDVVGFIDVGYAGDPMASQPSPSVDVTYWWIQSMAVLPTHQGYGLGGRLLERALTDARDVGCIEVRCLLEMDAASERRERFFTSHGFACAPGVTEEWVCDLAARH